MQGLSVESTSKVYSTMTSNHCSCADCSEQDDLIKLNGATATQAKGSDMTYRSDFRVQLNPYLPKNPKQVLKP